MCRIVKKSARARSAPDNNNSVYEVHAAVCAVRRCRRVFIIIARAVDIFALDYNAATASVFRRRGVLCVCVQGIVHIKQWRECN